MNGRNHDVEKQRYWQRTIGDAARSGMSIREFCRQRRLKESQFYWWQRKLKSQPSGAEQADLFGTEQQAFALVSEDGSEHAGRIGAGAAGRSSATHQPGSSGRDLASGTGSHGVVGK